MDSKFLIKEKETVKQVTGVTDPEKTFGESRWQHGDSKYPEDT